MGEFKPWPVGERKPDLLAATIEDQAVAEAKAIADQYLSLSENGRRHLRALMDSLVKLEMKA